MHAYKLSLLHDTASKAFMYYTNTYVYDIYTFAK